MEAIEFFSVRDFLYEETYCDDDKMIEKSPLYQTTLNRATSTCVPLRGSF